MHKAALLMKLDCPSAAVTEGCYKELTGHTVDGKGYTSAPRYGSLELFVSGDEGKLPCLIIIGLASAASQRSNRRSNR